jgi:hypothetical protein
MYKRGDTVQALYFEDEGEAGELHVCKIVKVFQLIDVMTTQFYVVKDDDGGGKWTVSEDQIKANEEQHQLNMT